MEIYWQVLRGEGGVGGVCDMIWVSFKSYQSGCLLEDHLQRDRGPSEGEISEAEVKGD